MALTLGYKASAEQFAPRELLAFSQQAEASGFDSVFVSDHLQPWRHNGGHAPAALPWLGALVATTERIKIGTSVLTPTFRYHPGVVAQAFASLGCLAPGRIILGLGSGESMNEVPLGLAWPDGKERFARLKEAIALIRQLWHEDRVTFEGTYYETERATIYDRPETPVPLYVAASGPAATRLSGRVADGFICTSGKGRELYVETLLPALAEGAQKVGRTLSDLDLMIEVKVSFDPDPEAAMNNTRFWGALALSPDEKMGVEDPVEMERLADVLPAERTASRWIVSTDPDEHVERIWEYVDMGFRHLVFHAPGPDQRRFFDLYEQQILPRLRERSLPA
ncbi:MAG: glucose-6-phosphate dehydrogenase (coenzyme-F420) [Nostocoides sp.]